MIKFHSISSKILLFLQSNPLFTPYGVLIFYSVVLTWYKNFVFLCKEYNLIFWDIVTDRNGLWEHLENLLYRSSVYDHPIQINLHSYLNQVSR